MSAASPSLIEVLRRIPTRWRRLLTVLGTVAGVMIGGAVPAWATSETPPALSWMVLKDSKGINVWSYEMSLNTGGVTSPGKFVWSFLVALVWQGYRAIVVFAIWLINWVLGFSWLDWVSTPVIALSKSITRLVHTFGLAPTFLTIMAATAAVHIFVAAGRWGRSISSWAARSPPWLWEACPTLSVWSPASPVTSCSPATWVWSCPQV